MRNREKSQRAGQEEGDGCITDFVKSCDFYRVMPKELTEPTVSGGASKFLSLFA